MGGGGKSSTSSQTVSIPPEVLARYNAVNARAEKTAEQPFKQYGGEFVAPLTATQTAGIQNTSAASQLAQPYYGAATGLTMSGARDVGPLTQDQIGYYQNPFTQSVVNPTVQALQQQQGQQLAQQQAEAIKGGAFGGDRAGIQRAQLMGQQNLGMAQAIAPLYQQGYQQAVQTAQQQQGVVGSDLARRMQAGQQIAGLGTGAQQAALQGSQAQIGAGTLQQQTQQAQDTAQYQQFLQERGYDFQVAQFLANIAMGTGALSGSTTTSTQPRGFFSNRGGFKTGESLHRAGKAYGGGLDPNSMGGAVYQPGAFERGGYATSGSVVDSTDLAAILAQQRQSFGPFASAGPYGQAAGATPHGPGGIVPQQQLATPKLVTAGPLPKQQAGAGSDLGKVYSLADEATKGLSGKGLTERAGEKMGLRGAPKGANDVDVKDAGQARDLTESEFKNLAKPSSSSAPESSVEPGLLDKAKGFFGFEHGGGVMPRHRYADGGSEDSQGDEAVPYDPSDVMGTKDPMEGVLKAGSQKPPQLKTAGGGGGGGGGGGLGGDIAKGLGMAKTALDVGTALFALSDKRLKDNVRPVGKTFDGQNIYSYNLGDKPTQLGLIAQEVRSKHPDAIGHRGKYLTVNYDEATRHAANRGHFYEGGIVPRQHHADGERAESDAPAVRTYSNEDLDRYGREAGQYQIDRESGGDPRARAKTSSAAGLGQFTDATARGVLQKNPQFVEGINYDPNARGFAATLPEDVQRKMVDAHARDQAAVLARTGIEPTPQNIRMNWFLGEAGGPAFLRRMQEDPSAPAHSLAGSDQVRANQNVFFNRDGSPRTAGEVYSLLNRSGGGGGGFGAGRPPADVGRPADAKGLGAGQEPGFFDRNKGIILPVLQGIGAMASSKSISPFAAALQGLGAGAKAYGEEETRQANIEQSKAQTFESAQRGSNLSFLRDGTLVRMPDGSLMLTVEAMKKGLIPLGGKIAGLAENSAASKYLQSIGINAPAATQYLKEPEPKVPDLGPKPIDQSIDPNMTDRGIFGNSSRQLAQKDAYRTMGLTPAGAAQVSKDYETSTAAAALAANNNTTIINSLAGNTSKIVNAQGLDAPGKTNEFRANIANGVNTLARSMGYKGEDILAGDTNAAIQNKLNTFLASQATEAAGQHNLGALRTLLGSMAQGDMPPQAQAKIAAQIMSMTQKAKDRDAHREVFGDVSGGSFATAGKAFEDDTRGRYEREERLLGALILKDPQAVEKLTTGTKSPQVIEQYFRNLSKATGVPYTPGLSRYFVSGVQ
tara:strand:+ start:2159 stop:5983 length:3825 start_codon:yes stop_codon:yes gene_type:complete